VDENGKELREDEIKNLIKAAVEESMKTPIRKPAEKLEIIEMALVVRKINLLETRYVTCN